MCLWMNATAPKAAHYTGYEASVIRCRFCRFYGHTFITQRQANKRRSIWRIYSHLSYDKAVADGVVLDLVFEARDVEQKLGDPQKIDEWFEARTAGLNTWQKQALQEKWATMRNVLSSRERIDKIVLDVIYDFAVKPRLNNGRGTAM